MNIRNVLPLFLVVWGCVGSPDNPHGSEGEELRLKNRQLREEQKRLIDEVIRLGVENLEWKIRDLRERNDGEALVRTVIVEGLGSNYAEIRLHTLKLIVAMKEEEIAPYASTIPMLVEDPDERVRAAAATALGRVESMEARAVLLIATKDPSPMARAAAVAAIAGFGDDEVVERILAMVADGDDSVKIATLAVVASLKDRRSVGPVIDLIMSRGTSDNVIEKGLDALGAIGAPNALDTIVLFLQHASQGIRWSAINAVGRIGNPLYAFHIHPFLDARHPPHVRLIALQSIAKLSDAEAKEVVREIMMNDPDPRLRGEAARYFAALGDVAIVETVLFPVILRDEDATVRRTIWQSIMTLAGGDLATLEKIGTLVVRHRLYHEADELLTAACAIDRARAIAGIGAKMAPAMLVVAANPSAEREARHDAFKILNTVYGTNHTIDDAAKAIVDWQRRMLEKKP